MLVEIQCNPYYVEVVTLGHSVGSGLLEIGISHGRNIHLVEYKDALKLELGTTVVRLEPVVHKLDVLLIQKYAVGILYSLKIAKLQFLMAA